MPTDSLNGRNSTSSRVSLPRIAVFACVFISIFLAFYIFEVRNAGRIEQQNARYAEDCAIQTAERVADELDNAKADIVSYAHFLERMIKSPEVDVALLEDLESMSNFKSLSFTDARGVTISSVGEQSDARAEVTHLNGMNGEVGVVFLPAPDPAGEGIFSFYAPVRFEGRVIGVLRGSYPPEASLREILRARYFGQEAAVYLCTPAGMVIAASPGESIRGDLMGALASSRMIDAATGIDARKALRDGARGSFIINEKSGADNLCVIQVPHYFYAIVQIFPPSVTEHMLKEANKAGIELEIFLIAVFSVFCLWLIWSGAVARRKLQRENREFSEVISGLDTLFNSRYCRADLESGEYSYVGDHLKGSTSKRSGSFAELLYIHANECASEREQADFRLFFALDNVIAQLSERDHFTYECHVRKNGAEAWENLITICLERKNGIPWRVLFLRQDVTELKEREYAAQKKLARMDRREKQYQLAITSSAIYAFEFNVTRNLVPESLFHEKQQQKASILARLGLQAPCQASDVFEAWGAAVLSDCRAEYDRVINQSYLLAAFHSGDSAIELSYWTRDTSEQEICVRQAFYLTRDNLSGDVMALSVIRDITPQVTRQREHTRSLQAALMQARQASKAKTVFLSNMSHDIRTPMNAIIGFSTIAVSHLHNRELVADSLRKVLSSSKHLLNLINDILDMSRIESGKMQLKEQEYNISDLTHNLVNIIQPQMKAKQLQLFINTWEVTDENVIIDSLKLNQVLINLLSNAVKYTPTGGSVTLRIMQKESLREGYAKYLFIVADNGVGMSAEFVRHIFEPFTRETTTTISGVQGTGLGMAITHSIVEMMGGSIEVETKPGKGSRFTVTLDVKICEKREPTPNLGELEGLHALVVDDDFDVCDSVSKMLRRMGLRSEWTSSGAEAVQRGRIAERNEDPFDIYIIDWRMPDMDGVETARHIREVAGNDMPIIVLTAYDWADIEEEARSAGVTAFCAKPIFMSDLKNALLRASSGKKQDNDDAWQPPDYAGKRILLVDDVEMNREIATFMLKESGFVVECANDGNDAVEMVRNSPENYYDIVLMDIQMPVMDGYEATRKIRGLSRKDVEKMPILAMTANAMEEDRTEALKNGMNDHIAKPLDIKLLFETLDKFISGDTRSKNTEDA